MLILKAHGRRCVLGRAPAYSRNLVTASVALAGIVWAAGVLWFLPGADFATKAMFCCFAVGLSAGAAVSLNVTKWTATVLTAPTFATILPILLYQASTTAALMASAVAVFAIAMAGVARAGRRQTTKTILLWLENRRLSRNLLESRAKETAAQIEALEAEVARRQAEAAESAKTKFLGIIGHELKTPINGIVGFAGMIEQEIHGALGDPQYHDYAQEIGRCGDDLRRLIDKLLLFARSSRGDHKAQRVSIQLAALCRTVEHDVRSAGMKRRIEVVVEPPDLTVVGDPRMLGQLLWELLENADKFSPADKPIEIACVRAMNDRARICVVDQGPGIPPDQVAAVMEPFVQAGEGYAREGEGLGLGLTLVRHFADLHDGQLTIGESPAGGAVVGVSLPMVHVVRSDDAGRITAAA